MDCFGKASSAGEKTRQKEAEDKINLKITTAQIKSYTETQTMPTLQYLADEFYEDNEIEYVITKDEEVGSTNKTKITVGNHDVIYTKLTDYPYEFGIDKDYKLSSINGTKVATVPENDGDSIISMTKSELDTYIETAINTKLQEYAKTEDISSKYVEKTELPQNISNVLNGNYNGTGNYGNNNKNSLTFTYAPKIVIIFTETLDTQNLSIGGIFMQGASTSAITTYSRDLDLRGTAVYNNVTWSNNGKTMTWYNNVDASAQLNTSCKYLYYAIY